MAKKAAARAGQKDGRITILITDIPGSRRHLVAFEAGQPSTTVITGTSIPEALGEFVGQVAARLGLKIVYIKDPAEFDRRRLPQ